MMMDLSNMSLCRRERGTDRVLLEADVRVDEDGGSKDRVKDWVQRTVHEWSDGERDETSRHESGKC